MDVKMYKLFRDSPFMIKLALKSKGFHFKLETMYIFKNILCISMGNPFKNFETLYKWNIFH